MTVPAFNKTSKLWVITEDGSELEPIDEWIIDPVFADKTLAYQMGQRFWSFDGNTINTPTLQEYNALIKAEKQLAMWREIQEERDTRKAGGVKVGVNWFHSDDTSRIQFLALMLYGANMPTNIMWKTMGGSFLQMTPTLVQQVFGTIAAQDTAIFVVAEQHRTIMNNSENPEDYDFMNGSPAWPQVFADTL